MTAGNPNLDGDGISAFTINNSGQIPVADWKEGVGCRVWGVGKETSFICGGENFFIGTDSDDKAVVMSLT
ncbi:hypothetical protein MTo_01453 [Microcystis aeruginosa NIES-1211]|jgi:hypothetical protein|nr:hypothetical protein B5D77_23395 [Microcystis sp. MC19]GBL14156.1 hypothetical protein MTo_01453 [Microcystis aeruginosa NIES-1211]